MIEDLVSASGVTVGWLPRLGEAVVLGLAAEGLPVRARLGEGDLPSPMHAGGQAAAERD